MEPTIDTLRLKILLDHFDHPEDLDDHRWINTLFFNNFLQNHPEIINLSPGKQLILSVCEQFKKMIPLQPPRRGLRLDNRWGEFGILAAQYFAPFMFGIPFPTSLREAWQYIDQAILLFMFGNGKQISPQDKQRYQLIGDESEVAPSSTISDWHRKGLERFANQLAHHEKFLQTQVLLSERQEKPAKKKSVLNKLQQSARLRKWVVITILSLLFLFVGLGGWKTYSIYQKMRDIRNQADGLVELISSPSRFENLSAAASNVSQLRFELHEFKGEVKPFLPLAPYMRWFPVYGGDLAQSPILLDMFIQLSIAGDELVQLASPLINSDQSVQSGNMLGILSDLDQMDASLIAAQVALANVTAARQQLEVEELSTQIKELVVNKLDPLLLSLDTAFPVTDVLQMARLAPRLLGAVGNGSQTYLLLIQNEDELRPTGGFLTAVGNLVVEQGDISEMTFASSDRMDDLKKPYPKAPWQLDEYMMAEILLLRDANWFTDFSTTVDWVKFLYAYTYSQTIDGIIALDQHVVIELLKITGPIDVVGVDQPVSAENALDFMRTAKQNTPPPGVASNDWDRKQFISWLAEPLLQKLLELDPSSRVQLSRTIMQLLDEKHILLQFNDPEMSSLISKSGWDGALQPLPNSDFLMMVDSNIGFNKTSALVKTEIEYNLDLTMPDNPLASVMVSLNNQSRNRQVATQTECIQAGSDIRDVPLDQRAYIIDDCYWSYLRIYTPALSQLVNSTPQDIPAHWHLRGEYIPPRTDLLDENIPGVQAYGTLWVIPPSRIMQTMFDYRISPNIVTFDARQQSYSYRLLVQKQPGTIAVPLTFRLRLPPDSQIIGATPPLQQEGDWWVLQTDLRQDLEVEISFKSN